MDLLNIIDNDEPWYDGGDEIIDLSDLENAEPHSSKNAGYDLTKIDDSILEDNDSQILDLSTFDRVGGGDKPPEEVIELGWFTGGRSNLKSGGAETYRLDTHKYSKTGLAQMIPDKVSECSIIVDGRKTCVPNDVAENVIKIAGASNMDEAKKKTSCNTEQCAVKKTLGGKVSRSAMDAIMATFYKPEGPTGTALLSNINIDSIMRQFEIKWPDFYAYNFNMKDYAEYSFRDGEVVHSPDTLATVTWQDINALGKKCCGCIINSDSYTGPGKHWMALFADWRGAERTVEFFNSSGNAPAPEFCNWIVKTKMAMGGECVHVNKIRHQHTKTECGVYSIFYIWARLSGRSWKEFAAEPIPDQVMFEFRQHLFAGGKDFDYGRFRAGNRISWEEGHNDGQQSKHDL